MSKTLIGSFLISSAVASAVLGGLFLNARRDTAARASGSRSEPSNDAPPHVEIDPPIIELAELRIVARRTSMSRKAQPASTPPSQELVPCSDWEELGPVHSARAGEVPRTRHVRRLCAAP